MHVICLYTGGGFGCKGSTWSHVVLAAMAARVVKRPVQLVLERPQMFAPVGGRPKTEQHIMLAADASGQLTAVRHDVLSSTSMIEDWTEPCAMLTRILYSCPNLATSHRLVRLNTGTPTFMRAPGEASGVLRWKWRWTNWPTAWVSTRWLCGCAITPSAMKIRIDRFRASHCASVIAWPASVSIGRVGIRHRVR